MTDKPRKDSEGQPEEDRADGLSLHPLDMDEALAGFLATDPEKVKEAERREKEERDADDADAGED